MLKSFKSDFCVNLHHHHRHHLALQLFVGFRLLSHVSRGSSILRYLLPLIYFSFFSSSMTSSYHRCLGLPTGLVPTGLQSNSFPVGLARSIRWIRPGHSILCALMNLTISAFHVVHVNFTPQILVKLCFMKCRLIALSNQNIDITASIILCVDDYFTVRYTRDWALNLSISRLFDFPSYC